MVEHSILLLVSALAASSLCASIPKSSEAVGATIPPSVKSLDSLTPATTQYNHSSDGLIADCESLCKVCNATGQVLNGVCLCYADNGGEVVCLHSPHLTSPEMGLKLDQQLEEGAEEAERGQRCLGVLGSARGALRNILGRGLTNMTSEDRLAEFRKRVDSLRSLSFLGRQRAKLLDNAPAGNLPTITPTVPKSNLPVSPFLTQPMGEKTLEVEKKSVQTFSGLMDLKNKYTAAAGPDPMEPGTVALENLPVAQALSRRSVNDMPPSLVEEEHLGNETLKLPASFLVPELKDQLEYTESVGIMGSFGEDGNIVGSSNPTISNIYVPGITIPDPNTIKRAVLSPPENKAHKTMDPLETLAAMTQGKTVPIIALNTADKIHTSPIILSGSNMKLPFNSPIKNQMIMLQDIAKIKDSKPIEEVTDSESNEEGPGLSGVRILPIHQISKEN